MTLSGSFLAFAGSVTGRDHRRAERDGQDGYALVETDEVVAAIVTDGCSSGRTSELGARVGAVWLAALVARRFAGVCAVSDVCAVGDVGDVRAVSAVSDVGDVGDVGGPLVTAARDVTRELLDRLELLARSFDPAGEIHAARVGDALLFGFLAAVVTPGGAVVFGVGDGIVAIGDRVISIDPGPENAPPYLAYGLLRQERLDATAPSRIERVALAPSIHFVGPTSDLDALAVATDGAAPLVARSATEQEITLAALVRDPRLARNPSLLRKRLLVLSDRGTFSDDTTIAVVRRRPA